jgi:hypothetical protein
MDVRGLLIDLIDVLIDSALAWPLVKGRVEMNHFYGVRVRQVFESEEKWY